MSEKNRYPQIPGTVWWGVRSIFQRTPSVNLDERLLGVQLGVQEAGARAYIAELKNVGLLTEDGKASPLAQKWRLDESYAEAVQELIEATYPESLRAVAPPGEADRQKVVNWFLREGLGQGAAGNKAATYLLLSSANPDYAPSRSSGRPTSDENVVRAAGTAKAVNSNQPTEKKLRSRKAKQPSVADERSGSRTVSQEVFPLNVNVQIHISAEAGSDQIESIFSAMRRYLYDPQHT